MQSRERQRKESIGGINDTEGLIGIRQSPINEKNSQPHAGSKAGEPTFKYKVQRSQGLPRRNLGTVLKSAPPRYHFTKLPMYRR